MSLHIIVGNRKDVDRSLVEYALSHYPCVLVDASNSANIHRFTGHDPHVFAQVYVVEVEALYRLTGTLKRLSRIATALNTTNIFITTFRLFNYDDTQEIQNIFVFAWEMLDQLARDFDVTIAVESESIHEYLATVHGARRILMGHTLTSQRMIVDNILRDLEAYGKSLSAEDRKIYAQLLHEPLKRMGSITYTSSMNTWAILLLSIMLEREKNERMAHGYVQGREQDHIVGQDE